MFLLFFLFSFALEEYSLPIALCAYDLWERRDSTPLTQKRVDLQATATRHRGRTPLKKKEPPNSKVPFGGFWNLYRRSKSRKPILPCSPSLVHETVGPITDNCSTKLTIITI